jgi:hypothetical protein
MVHQRHGDVFGDQKCTIYGLADETEHHALISCTMAVALRSAMREIWPLSDELQFQDDGDNWLLRLLQSATDVQRDLLLLLFWKTRANRNQLVHEQMRVSIEGSRYFLDQYHVTLTDMGKTNVKANGKEPVLDRFACHDPKKKISDKRVRLK